jgi:thiaminase/transcriptional activator TenA
MSAARPSDELRKAAEPIWHRTLQHPFVRGLGDGSLTLDAFRFYLRQDYVFLIEYSRVLSLACAKANDLSAIQVFSGLMHDTLHKEMALHREFSARLGVSERELESTEPAMVTAGYTRHLLSVAYAGSVADILAAILPCQLGYAEIGAELNRRGVPAVEYYAEWIRMYASEEFRASAETLRRMMDNMTAGWPDSALAPLREHFIISSRFEYAFWEMAITQSQWPV